MADRVVPVDVRSVIVTWSDARRGAVSAFCAEYGVSRSQFYAIRARARAEGPVAAMLPRPRAAGRAPNATPVEVEELAVRIRKDLADAGWDHGPVTVHWRLRDLGVVAPAPSTLARIFRGRGMVVPQPQKRPRTSWRRFEAASVHECWQLDGFEWSLADGASFAVLQLTDDKSRFPIATRAAAGERAEDAVALVRAGVDRFQPPCRLLTDNGSAFNQDRIGRRTRLVDYLESIGCRPVTGRPGHPQTQGKNERVHETLQQWLRARDRPRDLAEAQALLDEFDHAFADRRHQGLAMATPAQALAAGPVAVPPLPPQPTARPARPVTARYHRVSANGNLAAAGATIHLGYEVRGRTVLVLCNGRALDVFDDRGAHIRSVQLEPGRSYYGNSRPRGRRANGNCPD